MHWQQNIEKFLDPHLSEIVTYSVSRVLGHAAFDVLQNIYVNDLYCIGMALTSKLTPFANSSRHVISLNRFTLIISNTTTGDATTKPRYSL